MATETTGAVESAGDFFADMFAECVQFHYDGETWDTTKAHEMIRQRDAAVVQPFLDALREHHGCEHDMRELKGTGIMEPCGRIGNWYKHNWDSEASWYCEEHAQKQKQYAPIHRSESITRALLAQEKADG